MTATSPYGSWRSSIGAHQLVDRSVSLSDLSFDQGELYWSETRPSEKGRRVIVGKSTSGPPRDLFGPPFSARTFVHEYGGRCYVVDDGTLYFSNQDDQAVYACRPGKEPLRLTSKDKDAEAVYFADFASAHEALIAIRERHGVGGRSGVAATLNDLVAIDKVSGAVTVLSSGRDFYASPRLSPDGEELAFVAWDHPNMAWDESGLYVLHLATGVVSEVRASPHVSVSQPRFSTSGELYYLCDEPGFYSIFSARSGVVVSIGADLGGPDWVFGQSSYLPYGDAFVVVAEGPGGDRLGVCSEGGFDQVGDRFSMISSLVDTSDGLAAIVGSDAEPHAVARFDRSLRDLEIVRPSSELTVDRSYLAKSEVVTVKGPTGDVHALYYPPTNPDYVASKGELPPLVVESHGGPTSRTAALYDLSTQYLTSRGIGVVKVDYGGSSGYGRAYRERLAGKWGVVDVADCAAVATALVADGRADPDRLAIRGRSAGGFTTLAALCFTDTFAVGASHFGVSDLVALASDTHKFESRYLDRLVGDLDADRARYEERSPLLQAEKISCPVIFFQGLDDPIVPPDQAKSMVEALRLNGVPVAYLSFSGERHGFQRAETIVTVAEAELFFFASVLGFTPADELSPVPIDNAEALRAS